MAMPSKSAIRALRPSLVVAEALVDRQNPVQIVDRAQKLGFSRVLTTAVVGVTCGQKHCSTLTSPSPRTTLKSSRP